MTENEVIEPPPSSYGDLMVEAIRTAIVSPTEVIVGFQIWDMDDFDNEISLLFRVREYREIERIAAHPRLLRDLFSVDGQAFAIGYRGVQRVQPERSNGKLPIGGACAMTGRAANDLIAVGDGVARFDGKKWRKLEGPEVELLCVTMHGDVVYAAGKDGCVVRIDGNQMTVRTVRDLGDVTSLAVDDGGRLSLVGNGHVAEGSFPKLVARRLSAVSVCHFRGQRYWGVVGDDPAMGLFVDKGKLERVSPLMAYGLIADDKHLYGGGEYEVFRFDGKKFRTLKLKYDKTASRWNLAPAK